MTKTTKRNADAAFPPTGDNPPAGRVLVLLTAVVIGAHLVVLAVLPAGTGPSPLPPANKLIARTIVTAPPAAPVETPVPPTATPPPPPPRVAQPVPAPPKRPRAPTPPPRAETSATAPEPTALAEALAAEVQMASASAPASAAAGAVPGGASGASGASATSAGSGAGPAGAESTAGAAHPMVVPGSVTLSFEATGQRGQQPMSGVFGELVWLQNGNEYNARLLMKLLFVNLLNWTSSGSVDAYGIAPTRYSESRRSEVASHLVRDQGKVVFSNNAPSVPLLPGAQDRLSVVMQLGALIAGNPAGFPPGSRIEVQTVGPRDADVWVFNVEGDEMIEVTAGRFMARRLTRSPRREFDYKLELWLAPEIGYLPVRMLKTETNGDIIDMRLRGKSAPLVLN